MSSREIPLFSWWSAARKDNFATTDRAWAAAPGTSIEAHDGYTMYRIEGALFAPDDPQPGGTVRVSRFYSPSRGDNFLTTDPRHLPGDILAPDYHHSRHEGYLYDPKRPQPRGTVPIFSWWNSDRGDNFATSNPDWSMPVGEIEWAGEHVSNGPVREGYRLYRLEGFAKTFDLDTLDDFVRDRMKVCYKLIIDIHEDNNRDEPRLDLVVASFGGYYQIEAHTTGTLANHSGLDIGSGGSIQPLPGEDVRNTYRGCFDVEHPANGADPHLALAIRAVDEDNSSDENRGKDLNYFKRGIRNALERATSGGVILTEPVLQSAAGEELIDRFGRDDDDKIGVAVAVITDCYRQSVAVCRTPPLGNNEGVREDFPGSLPHILLVRQYTLEGDGARYLLDIVISVDHFSE
ncbi:hypothetical protein M2324_000998 [Rhodovulum sulfidophilum]|uniref:hypothetical protein n=1 Tax=Rhodovulum sulfidophilum TaxID=35806 RepID=UPI000697E05B|nr:hypothetical protein [Rhodovulum sulfidophilum]ANB32989.1 hypothetical protein A6W98_02185 [Rhodovulum sulfidophilum DSM 1374]ANB36838.1 hypothetical protein A6024_02170 [Rhodovulum sulfidophilum]MCW2302614.1 hypothetical protein [Rhodovulum sulfidophilum]